MRLGLNVPSYRPGRANIWSATQWGRLISQFDRLAAVDVIAGENVIRHKDTPAERALRFGQSTEFRSITRIVCDAVTTAGEKLALPLTENDIRRHKEVLPEPPVLLETRIGMMVAAAEILCRWDHTDPIHEEIARPILASLPRRRRPLSQHC
jgi:hypothetical protein